MTSFNVDAMARHGGTGVWEHRGKVAAVGLGHTRTARRWDGRPETSVGALAIEALRQAMEDAGVTPDQVDGLVLDPVTTTGAYWPEGQPIPQDFLDMFEQTADPMDGLAQLSVDWILKNMPELKNVTFAVHAPRCMSHAVTVGAQAVGDGLAKTCLVLKGWHNFAGRYYHGGTNAADTVSGATKWGAAWAGPASTTTAMQFQRYLHQYGKTHDMMWPFMANSRKNGLLFPEGYWAQHRPEELGFEDYTHARWIAEPANLFDNDLPIHVAAAYLFTTADRAVDMKQKPAYIWNHYKNNHVARGVFPTLEDVQESTAMTGREVLAGAGISVDDLSFENMYDGFTLFHLEGLGFAGIKQGEALDYFASEDITIHGPNPISPSGGNIGSGRTRFWMHSDSIQQIQGRAGARQINRPAEIGISGGPMPQNGWFTVWSATPD
ncbi:MAG: hypothetical protein WD942_08270 [Dehalococcoidia bacterium]